MKKTTPSPFKKAKLDDVLLAMLKTPPPPSVQKRTSKKTGKR